MAVTFKGRVSKKKDLKWNSPSSSSSSLLLILFLFIFIIFIIIFNGMWRFVGMWFKVKINISNVHNFEFLVGSSFDFYYYCVCIKYIVHFWYIVPACCRCRHRRRRRLVHLLFLLCVYIELMPIYSRRLVLHFKFNIYVVYI